MKNSLKAIITALVTNVILLLLYFGVVVPEQLIPIVIGLLVMLISSFTNAGSTYSVDTMPVKKTTAQMFTIGWYLGLLIAVLTVVYNYITTL